MLQLILIESSLKNSKMFIQIHHPLIYHEERKLTEKLRHSNFDSGGQPKAGKNKKRN